MKELRPHPVTLVFPPELEREYRDSKVDSDVSRVRIALLVATLAWVLYGFVDAMIFTEDLRRVLTVRMVSFPPLAILIFALSYLPVFPRLQQGLTFAALVGVGGVFTWFMWLEPVLGSTANLPGLILLFLFGYAFSRARFPVASAAGLSIIVTFSTVFAVTDRIPAVSFISFSSVLTIANVTGMIVSYSLESTERREFLRLRSLSGDVKTAVRQSEWLESMVSERTKELATTNRLLRSEIAERKSAEDRLQYLAAHDVLTGLANRRFFEEELSASIDRAEETGQQVAVILLDVDKFKAINDGFGHRFGDLLLRTVGARIQDALRLLDTVARFGGDEFAVIVPRFESLDAVRTVAARIVASVGRPIEVEGRVIETTTSVGIGVYPEHAADSAGLIRCADSAMYQVKAQRGNGYAFFSRDLDVRISRRSLLERKLSTAVDQDQFSLVYQPKLALADLSLHGMEALIRWSPGDGIQSNPDEFIPIAEASASIIRIGEWVLRTALETARRLGPAVNVNISARQLQDRNFPAILQSALSDSGIAPDNLCIEITESVLMQDLADARDHLLDLRSMGIRISIDDFGTGFSSLQYLSRLPIDELKIDRSFIESVGSSGADEAIVRAIIGLGKAVGAKVVAEGVETLDQMRFLEREGCDLIQGWLVARPCSEDDLAAFMDNPIPSKAL